jgi:hypothetical protein
MTRAPDFDVLPPSAEHINEQVDAILILSPVDVTELTSLIASLPPAARGLVFDRLRDRLGGSEASRLWLVVFSASDAAQT